MLLSHRPREPNAMNLRRASASLSLSSYDSGSSRASGKRRAGLGSLPFRTRTKKKKVRRTLTSLELDRGKGTDLRLRRVRSLTADVSTRNEEWDCSSFRRAPKVSSKILPLSNNRPPERKSSMKERTRRGAAAEKRSVTFGENRVCHHASPAAGSWYEHTDFDRFAKDAEACAETARRVMGYASMVEDSYNSSIGLTSPQVLEEYLSCPHEIIGIENLLAGQGDARRSLVHFHRENLVEAQRRQRREGSDPSSLAEALGEKSRISGHMARERAAYVVRMD